jgi:hypothetical protein
MKERAVIFSSDAEAAGYLYRALRDRAEVVGILIERGVPRSGVLKRRLRRFGLVSALGQALFVGLVVPFLQLTCRGRIRELEKEMAGMPVPDALLHRVASINSPEAVSLLRSLAPSLVVVWGTRIIGAQTLGATGAQFINIHAGITPRYRGGHGGYWALAEGDAAHCGVTVHRIDSGIDTGEILAQKRIELTAHDSFVTYPLLQLIAGARAVCELLDAGRERWPLAIMPAPENSARALYAHPTLWGYLYCRLTRGVR